MHQMAQAHRADMLREAEGYRRAGPRTRPTVPLRLTARIRHLPSGSRSRVVISSTCNPPDPDRAA
jgi:hypothetical protein